ncbi:S8 family serine peptidase [Roseivivax isoporae]|uniref:Peptidase S8 n=1 Tax=Roseivivax isoporae LMG 25204 TaxID=1449351 RepID=X7F920_9RHOB|nr:S8 family serine peptidase [Roseivivax isoporae]ETX28554.1 peptidase S8 [Roseivivax isoporae LMG 25204]
MARYIILRDGNAGFRSRGTSLESGLSAAVPPRPLIETADLGPAEVREATRDPGIISVARAMPTKLVETATVEAAAGRSGQPTWGVQAVGADLSPFTGAGVRVCVLDTGIDQGHAAFQGVMLTTRDFTGEGVHDGNGHGTHCAGTIFGRDVDGTRIGVARGVTDALIGKVLDNSGGGSSDMLFDALRWASSEGCRVISMSLGFDFPGFAAQLQADGFPPVLATSIALEGYRTNLRMFDALMEMMRAQAAFDGGVVVCAAAGNESARDQDPNFEVSASVPAAAFGVISVGALGQGPAGFVVAPFSNTNPVIGEVSASPSAASRTARPAKISVSAGIAPIRSASLPPRMLPAATEAP